MIRYNLAPLMQRHGLENASQLAAFAKIPAPLAYRVLDEAPLERIQVSTLDALVRAFRLNAPWALLRYERD